MLILGNLVLLSLKQPTKMFELFHMEDFVEEGHFQICALRSLGGKMLTKSSCPCKILDNSFRYL